LETETLIFSKKPQKTQEKLKLIPSFLVKIILSEENGRKDKGDKRHLKWQRFEEQQNCLV